MPAFNYKFTRPLCLSAEKILRWYAAGKCMYTYMYVWKIMSTRRQADERCKAKKKLKSSWMQCSTARITANVNNVACNLKVANNNSVGLAANNCNNWRCNTVRMCEFSLRMRAHYTSIVATVSCHAIPFSITYVCVCMLFAKLALIVCQWCLECWLLIFCCTALSASICQWSAYALRMRNCAFACLSAVLAARLALHFFCASINWIV